MKNIVAVNTRLNSVGFQNPSVPEKVIGLRLLYNGYSNELDLEKSPLSREIIECQY